MSVNTVSAVGAGGTNSAAYTANPAVISVAEGSAILSQAPAPVENSASGNNAAGNGGTDAQTTRKKLQEAVRVARQKLKDAETAEKTAEALLASHRMAGATKADLYQDKITVELRKRDVETAKQELDAAEQALAQAPTADHSV